MARNRNSASKLRDELIFSVLDEVSRHRPLASPESELMELAMHRLGIVPGAEQTPEQQMRRRMQLLAKRNALHQRDVALCDLLSKLQVFRPLDRNETWLLAGAVHRLGLTHDKWHWTPEEDEMILRLLRNRSRRRPKRPFTANNEVERLAAQLGRSYWAVQRRIERLRKGNGKMFKRANGHASLDSADGRQNQSYKTLPPEDGRAAAANPPAEAARPQGMEA